MAEDAVQEAYTVAHRKLRNLRNAAAFPLWFSRIVQTKARQLRNQLYRSTSDYELDPVDPAQEPYAALEKEITASSVLRAVGRLSDIQRAALRLSYFEDLSNSSISSALKISANTVKKRIYDARHRLKIMIGDPSRLINIKTASSPSWPFMEVLMNLTENKKVVQEWNRRFRAYDASFKELADPANVHHGQEDRDGVKASIELLELLKETSADYVIADMIGEGDRVAAWFVNKGKPHPDILDPLCCIFTIKDGKVTETVLPSYYKR